MEGREGSFTCLEGRRTLKVRWLFYAQERTQGVTPRTWNYAAKAAYGPRIFLHWEKYHMTTRWNDPFGFFIYIHNEKKSGAGDGKKRWVFAY